MNSLPCITLTLVSPHTYNTPTSMCPCLLLWTMQTHAKSCTSLNTPSLHTPGHLCPLLHNIYSQYTLFPTADRDRKQSTGHRATGCRKPKKQAESQRPRLRISAPLFPMRMGGASHSLQTSPHLQSRVKSVSSMSAFLLSIHMAVFELGHSENCSSWGCGPQ